jgi:hypothetical protein
MTWCPHLPTEAMDRIHRLGQHRPVKAIKLVVEDSIESRIIQVCATSIYFFIEVLGLNLARTSSKKRNLRW